MQGKYLPASVADESAAECVASKDDTIRKIKEALTVMCLHHLQLSILSSLPACQLFVIAFHFLLQ